MLSRIVLGLIAMVLFIIAAILAWLGKDRATAIAYAGLAFLAAQVIVGWRYSHSV